MKKRAFLVVSVVLALSLVLAGASIAQQKKFFVISTGGTGGTYYPLGGILAQALTEKVPEVVTTAQAGQASVANCN
ncbi:MAG: C4-dicarboxylate ABC transporter substrate-binding protein, partial [Syntrophobacterales bacterium]|nr:C4-dicarboxylate ABC transporter substrate-binding protein [Syntrophobacterales bacterium]